MKPENTPRLETDRLILRRFVPEDAEALFLIHRDPEVNRFLPWFPTETLEAAEQFLKERYLTLYRQLRGYGYAVCRKEDDLPIGYVGVGMEESHDLGYGLRKDFWRQGIMTEACRAVIEQVKNDGLPYLTATHDVNNPRSGEVMKRLGMRYCYSYREQWMPKNFPVVFRMYQLDLDGENDRVYRGYWEQFPQHFVEELT